MSDLSDCDCCGGTAIDTPAGKSNPPGLPAIAYRVGTHGTFKSTLLARLSGVDLPALSELKTRKDDDYTIALCDSFAVLGDVLTFYQERIANESYLRTATERGSVLHLAELIGYQLAPGVAASTALAFTLEAAPGAPVLAAQPVTIPVGTRVQSVPDAGQDPQTFETVAAITGRVEWNAIPAQASEPAWAVPGLSELTIAGTNAQLQPGDAIAIVRSASLWDVRWINGVTVDARRNTTRITWSGALGSKWPAASTEGVHVFAFRQRAALFGSSAPDPKLIFGKNNADVHGLTVSGGGTKWANFIVDAVNQRIDLDAAYPRIVVGSWIALAANDAAGTVRLYRVKDAVQLSCSAYAISARVTRITPDPATDLDKFGLRETVVLAQSEELSLAERPLAYPAYGSALALAGRHPELEPGQLVALSGKRQRVVIGVNVSGVSIVLADGSKRTPIPGESFRMHAPPRQLVGGSFVSLDAEALDPVQALNGTIVWPLEEHDGTVLTAEAPAGALTLQAALKDDTTVSEICTILAGPDGVTTDLTRTRLKFQAPTQHCYERATVAVNANVAPATHGETVGELAGSGHAGRVNQNFALKQAPLTHMSSPSDPRGGAATLQARVGDALWHEVPTLYGRGPLERVYTLRQGEDGRSTIQFGDGVQGARLPSGQNNLRLTYRKGSGVAGNLRPEQLTMLLTRPLGVKAATNPVAATGGQDAETLADARSNAPLPVRTLDRAVSVQDYVDYAQTFGGIAKAYGIWIDNGRARGVHLTVAGPGGAVIPKGSETHKNLIGSLRRHGDPLLPLTVQPHGAATFRLTAAIKIVDDAEHKTVLEAVERALRAAYGFAPRAFGQPVTIDEVYATIQRVGGVIAADISQLYRQDLGVATVEPQARLLAALPFVQGDGSVTAAELLTLDPAPLALAVMS